MHTWPLQLTELAMLYLPEAQKEFSGASQWIYQFLCKVIELHHAPLPIHTWPLQLSTGAMP